MTVEFIQPPTEISTMNLPGAKELLTRRSDNLTAIYEPIV
jgi:hypothetical protein